MYVLKINYMNNPSELQVKLIKRNMFPESYIIRIDNIYKEWVVMCIYETLFTCNEF